MKDRKHRFGLRVAKWLITVMTTVPFALCWYLYYADRILTPFYNKGNWLVIALFVAMYAILAKIYDAYQISTSRISDMLYSQGLATILADCAMYVVIWLLTRYIPNPLPGLATAVVQMVLIAVWAALAHHWYFKTFPPKKAAIVADKHYQIDKLIREYGLEKKFDICKTVNAGVCIEKLDMLDNMETVFISGVHSHDRNVILKYCVARGITVYVLPRIGDIILSGAKQVHMFHLPMLRLDRAMMKPENVAIKRCLDIVVSLVALIVASPVMLISAIAIKAEDGGPVLYRQTRLTKDGNTFQIAKFRSMRVDAEKDGVARLSTGDNDDRITRVGRIIRKLRIDELPQLLNVLHGTMSIVGPRPERPEIAEQYEQTLPEFRLRLQVKAGLTGYAQVYGKYNTTPYDKLQMDLMYIANPSIFEDLRILLATVKILFMPESTEGVAEGQTTAAQDDSEKDLLEVGKK